MSTSNATHDVGAARFCGQCGAPLGPGDRFCGACGAPVETASAPPPPAAPAAARPAEPSPAPPTPAARPASAAAMQETVPPRREPALGAGHQVAAFVATVANWGLGWLIGGGLGAYVFAELLFRYAGIHGTPLPGIATVGSSGSDGLAIIAGVDPGGILFWGLSGVVGGIVAAAIVAIADRRGVSANPTRHGLAALVWIVAIAAVIDLYMPILLPIAAAANGAWFGWRGETRGRSALRHAGAWFLGAICGLALIWAARSA